MIFADQTLFNDKGIGKPNAANIPASPLSRSQRPWSATEGRWNGQKRGQLCRLLGPAQTRGGLGPGTTGG